MVTASPARVPAVRRGGAGARRDRARAVVATLCRRCPPGGGRPFSPQVVVAGTGRPVACVAAIGLFAAVRGPLRRTPRAEARPTVVAVTDAGRSPRARGRVRSDRPRRRRRGRAQGGFGRWPGLPDGVREAAPPPGSPAADGRSGAAGRCPRSRHGRAHRPVPPGARRPCRRSRPRAAYARRGHRNPLARGTPGSPARPARNRRSCRAASAGCARHLAGTWKTAATGRHEAPPPRTEIGPARRRNRTPGCTEEPGCAPLAGNDAHPRRSSLLFCNHRFGRARCRDPPIGTTLVGGRPGARPRARRARRVRRGGASTDRRKVGEKAHF